jgi:ATP-binding cassette subfamily B protein
MRAAHLNQNSVLGFIWHFAAKNKVLLFFIQIGALGFAIDNAIWPYFTGYLIDTLSAYKGSSGAIWDNLGYLFILAAVLEGVIILLYRLNGILLSYFFPKFEANIRMYMFEYVQNHSHKYFMNNLSGKIANKINDMPNSAYLIVEQLLNIYIPTFLAVSCSTIIFYYLSPSFASFLLGWVVVHLSIVVVTARKCHYQSLIHSESRSVVQGRILDNISNSAVVRVFARMKYELNFVKKYQKVEKDLYFRSLIFNEKIKIFQGLNHFAFFIFIGFLVIEDFRNEIISVGELVLILSSFLNISFMVWYTGIELPFFIRQIGICSQALSVIRDVHDI